MGTKKTIYIFLAIMVNPLVVSVGLCQEVESPQIASDRLLDTGGTLSNASSVDVVIDEVNAIINEPRVQLAEVPFSEVVTRRLSGLSTSVQFLQQPKAPVHLPPQVPKVPQLPQHLKQQHPPKQPVVPYLPKRPTSVYRVRRAVMPQPVRPPHNVPKVPQQPKRRR